MSQRKSNMEARSQSNISEHPSMSFDGNPMSSQTCLQGKKAGQRKKDSILKRFFTSKFWRSS
jgi:hypothetical protein